MAIVERQRLTPKKYALNLGGASLIGTGGWLLWTVVAYSLAVPLMLIGVGMTIASRFVKTNVITCPACKSALTVEKTVSAITCPRCRTAIKLGNGI